MIELNKDPKALYLLALQFHYVLDDYALATRVYEWLIKNHPNTPYAHIATMQLHPDYQPGLKKDSLLRLLRHSLE